MVSQNKEIFEKQSKSDRNEANNSGSTTTEFKPPFSKNRSNMHEEGPGSFGFTHSLMEDHLSHHLSEPATVIFEEGDYLVIDIELPDMSKQDIDIQWRNNILTIKGTKRPKWSNIHQLVIHSNNYWFGNFQHNINLGFIPEASNAIKANFTNGILSIKVKMPKSCISKSEVIALSN
jgi:HSP20 family protein